MSVIFSLHEPHALDYVRPNWRSAQTGLQESRDNHRSACNATKLDIKCKVGEANISSG